jgi:hypothetical protein
VSDNTAESYADTGFAVFFSVLLTLCVVAALYHNSWVPGQKFKWECEQRGGVVEQNDLCVKDEKIIERR